MLRGRTMADIGTDHAYLPVFGGARNLPAIASDIGEGPLRAAREDECAV